MEGFLKLFIATSFLFVTTNLYPEDIDGCSSYFIQQPFLQKTNPTKDQEEFITLIDKQPLAIHSTILSSKSRNWLLDINSQKDSSKVLELLLDKSDLSIDSAIHVISNLLIPKFDELKNINTEKEKYRFYELLFDVLGMKDIELSISEIQRQSRKLSSLLPLWSSHGIEKAYKEIKYLIEIITERNAISTEHKFFEALSQNRPLFKKKYNAKSQKREFVSLREIVAAEISTEDYMDIPSDLVKKIASSKKFKTLKKVINFDEAEMFSLAIFATRLHMLDALCWDYYIKNLRQQTLSAIGKLLQLTNNFKKKLENLDLDSNLASSSFLKDNLKTFLNGSGLFNRGINDMIKQLEKIHSLIYRFNYKKTFLDSSNIDIFFDIYRKTLNFPSFIKKYQNLSSDNISLISPVWGMIEVFYNQLATHYNLVSKDESGHSYLYKYFTDFSFIKSKDYQDFLSQKYGQKFLDVLLKTLTDELGVQIQIQDEQL